jgi:hypothetical protein
MKYLIIFILANLTQMAITPEEINFEQIDDYFRAQITGDIKQLDYHKGKLYLSYADADSHYITAFYNDLILEEYKSKYHEYYQYGPTLNFLISNDKKSYSVNIYKSEKEITSNHQGYNELSDDMVPVKHEIYRWSDDLKIYESDKYSKTMNSDYNYLYDKIMSNYRRIKYNGGLSSGVYAGRSETLIYTFKNSDNNNYIFTAYSKAIRWYWNGFVKIEFFDAKASLNQNVLNKIDLFFLNFYEMDNNYTNVGKNIQSPAFSYDEKYFVGRVYETPDMYSEYAYATDTLVIYELPVTKEPTYVKFDSLSNIKCFSPNSNSLLMVINNQIYDFDLFTGKQISKMDFTFDHEITKIDVSPENNTLAVVTKKTNRNFNNIYIFNYENYFSQIASVNETNENSISIYPNPAEDYIEITLGRHNVNKALQPLVQDGEFEIYDVLGNVVVDYVASKSTSVPLNRDTSAGGGQVRIDISHLPSGLYFVKIGNRVEKFVKK